MPKSKQRLTNQETANIEKRQTLPILYSLRNCPYAMRARMAIFKAQQIVRLRDVVLTDKPAEMIAASAKAEVPILVLANNTVIDESLAVMVWSLKQSDPENLLHKSTEQTLVDMLKLIALFDTEFKACLNQYKCAKRYKENTIEKYREACEVFILLLEKRLSQHKFLMSNNESLADIALLPFIRQFARVERQWYLQSPYPKLKDWLNQYLQSVMFTKVMAKYPLWLNDDEEILFGR